MAEYIEREALLNNRPVGRNIGQIGKEEYNKGWNDCRHAFVECVLEEPAADVVEVVRCKDCIHYEMGACLKIYSDGAVSTYAWQERKPDDFCSYGE